MSSGRSKGAAAGSAGDPDPKQLYAALGIAVDANEADIRKAYRRLALRWHPDKNPDNPAATAEFQKISSAYEVLSDPERRQLYDSTGCMDAEELEEDDAADLFAAFFGGLNEDLDAEEQAMIDELLRSMGGSAFRRRGKRRFRRGKAGKKAEERDMMAAMAAMFAGAGDLAGGSSAAEPECPKGHPLKRRKADSEYECDVCSKDIAVGKRMFDCRKCDFTVCQKCHRELSADLEAAAGAGGSEDESEEQFMESLCELCVEPVQEGGRLKFKCQFCKAKLAKPEVSAHMQSRHAEELEEVAMELMTSGGPMGMPGMMGMGMPGMGMPGMGMPGMGMPGMGGMGGLEFLLAEDLLGGGADEARPKGGARRKKKR
eukprot:TRINITY_DN818_c0_g1_i1.p1 TRINITY_DN818_c0_g1~~TRINITY_DN818_c0_g1_i1.p1  ORF type:complete len:372 (+),score=98.96 TRINITY_DN818_c0_g1_i1:114-1229(+)